MTMIPIQILVDDEAYAFAQEKGFVPLVERWANGSIKTHLKANVLQNGGQNAKMMADGLARKQMNAADVNRVLNQLGRMTNIKNGFLNIDNSLRDLSFDVSSICENEKALMAMAGLNIAISAADLALDAAGFFMISQKLTDTGRKIDAMAAELQDLKNLDKNAIHEQYHRLTMRWNQMADALASGTADTVKMENLLIDMNAFLEKLIDNVMDNSLEISFLLNMIYSLIVPYTVLLKSYLKDTFDGKLPGNTNEFFHLYERLLDQKYTDIVSDYWFLKCSQSNRNTVKTVNAMKLLTIECCSQADDIVDLLKIYRSGKKLDEADKEMNKAIYNHLGEIGGKLAEDLNLSPNDCIEQLKKAYEN